MADEADDLFVLKLVGEGLSLDRKVNREVAMAVFAAVMSGGKAPALAAKPAVANATPARAAMSPREFLNDVKPVNNAELIAAIGHYLCHHENHESFSNSDIKEGLRRAHEVVPKNLSRDVSNTIKASWIEPVPGKSGQYYVTKTGIKLVETTFGRAQ